MEQFQSNSTKEPSQLIRRRLGRSANACQRCRRRKQKCDMQYPKCGSCLRGHHECLIFDVQKDAEIPRSYICDLEGKLKRLTTELEELRAAVKQQDDDSFESQVSSMPPSYDKLSKTPVAQNNDVDLVVSMLWVHGADTFRRLQARVALGSTNNEPQFMGTSSGIALAKLVMAAVQDVFPSAIKSTSSSSSISSSLSFYQKPSSLPPRKAADHIVRLYFENRGPHFVFLDRQTVNEALDHVYDNTAVDHDNDTIELKKCLFLVYMVLAIGLCSIPSANNSRTRPLQSQGCFSSALHYIDTVLGFSQSNLDSLTIILLLAQYVTLYPTQGNLWQLSGIALRLCIDVGLHWEGGSVVNADPKTRDVRRTIFWTTYKLDRLLCIALGRPFGIIDNSISVGIPDNKPDSLNPDVNSTLPCAEKLASNHLIRIYQLESEIKHVLYHQFGSRTPSLAYPRPDHALWMPDIHRRIKEWYAEIPKASQTSSSHLLPSSSWWEALYNNAILLLHRPNPIFRRPSLESLEICTSVSKAQIRNIKTLHRDGKIDIIWIWVHRLFLAGLTMMYCIWHSREVRSHLTIEEVIESTQSCSSVLAALAEHSPGAASCRDDFDRLSAVTIKFFMNPETNTRGVQSPVVGPFVDPDWDFAGMTPDEAANVFNSNVSFDRSQDPSQGSPRPKERSDKGLFSFNTLQMGEMLQSAAQWPDTSISSGWTSMMGMDDDLMLFHQS
ncbi:MAG: hypothetical protein M1834_007056 [Cirrosporium novae-zelandiae]|nr:MAG: hypothetical protein M1834_007056 [Cirrosporium novae-zelandiae]